MRLACWFRRLAETRFEKVRDGETRALPGGRSRAGTRRRLRFRERFVEELLFFGEYRTGLGRENVFLRGRRLILVEQEDRGVNRRVRIVHAFGRQPVYDREAFGGPAEHVERVSVSHRDVHVVGSAIVRFLRETMAFRRVLIDEQSETRASRGDAGLVRRTLMQTLR